MNASPRRLSVVGPDGAAVRRLAARFGEGRTVLTANEALVQLDYALADNATPDPDMPDPTLNDLLDGLQQVDGAHVGLDWQELRLLTHARIRYGATWTQIAEARGFASRQGAQDRFNTLTARYPQQAQKYEQEARAAADRDKKEASPR